MRSHLKNVLDDVRREPWFYVLSFAAAVGIPLLGGLLLNH